ncbi:MAG: CorA family divalent cation transporter [Pseudomonadota bacterium]
MELVSDNEDGRIGSLAFDSDGRLITKAAINVEWRWESYGLADMRTQRYFMRREDLPIEVRNCLSASDQATFIDWSNDWCFGALPDVRHALHAQSGDPGRLRFAFNGKTMLTARRKPLQAMEDTISRIHAGHVKTPGPFAAIEAIINQLISHLATDLDHIVDVLDDAEELVVRGNRQAQDSSLPTVRRKLLANRRHIQGLTGLFRNLRVLDHNPQANEIQDAFERLSDRVNTLAHDCDQLSSRTRMLQDEINTQLTVQTNELLFVLSVLTAILMPATIVSGLFGMNVGGVPFLQTEWGFFLALALSAGGSLLVYRLIHRHTRRD